MSSEAASLPSASESIAEDSHQWWWFRQKLWTICVTLLLAWLCYFCMKYVKRILWVSLVSRARPSHPQGCEGLARETMGESSTSTALYLYLVSFPDPPHAPRRKIPRPVGIFRRGACGGSGNETNLYQPDLYSLVRSYPDPPRAPRRKSRKKRRGARGGSRFETIHVHM